MELFFLKARNGTESPYIMNIELITHLQIYIYLKHTHIHTEDSARDGGNSQWSQEKKQRKDISCIIKRNKKPPEIRTQKAKKKC